jgi:hypothetical protein
MGLKMTVKIPSKVLRIESNIYQHFNGEQKMFGGNMKKRMQAALVYAIKHPLIVFSAHCSKLNKVYFGVTYDRMIFQGDAKQLEIGLSDTPLSSDIRIQGINEFEFKAIASFSTVEEVHPYIEFLVNRALDDGIKCFNIDYNESVFIRYVKIRVNSLANVKLLRHCAETGIKLNDLIHKLIKNFLAPQKLPNSNLMNILPNDRSKRES